MVVFTCGYCGESVQKPKVEKHYTTTKCRNRNPNLSCMDCFKDFLGNSYEEHTKCITEEERYSGKGFVAKEKKGEKKQSTWIDLVQSVLDEQNGAPKNVLRIIETISKHNNTPRKKPKFFNFVKNVCGAKTGAKEIEQAWELIAPKLAALSNANQRNQNQTNGNKTNGETTENGHDESQERENGDSTESQDDHIQENGDNENTQEAPVEDKKLSKKQRKEEKKRQKYEAELQSAEAPLEEIEGEEVEGKKGKKKKNRTESKSENGETEQQEGKKNKRKRQDTVNSVSSNHEATEIVTELQNGTAKTQKKKAKVDEEAEAEYDMADSMCLHEQNVAKISELAMTDKFNWHAVILSVLQKKGNELPFKRLQKKVLSEYSESTGREIDDRIADKFIKKLKSAPNVRVDKNKVMLMD